MTARCRVNIGCANIGNADIETAATTAGATCQHLFSRPSMCMSR